MAGRVRLDGASAIRQALARLAKRIPTEVGKALVQEAEIELTEAKKRVPVDTGTLRASGHVTGPEYKGRSVAADIVFGGAAEDYALIVHEDLEAFHKVGQAKYLESVLNESAPHMAARVARRLKIEELL